MSENIKLVSGYVFDDINGEDLTLDKINRMFEDGFAQIVTPITIAQGGTGASNAADARKNLGIDITKADLANTSDPTLGDALIGYKNTCSANTIGRTVHLKLDEFLSVKDFGATGDGSTDDTAALQLALDDAGCNMLFVPPGTYNHTGLTVNSDTIIFGAGPGLSIFENTDTGGADAFDISGTGSDVEGGTPKSNIIIKDLSIKGNASSGDGISGNVISNLFLENILFDTNGALAVSIGADNASDTVNKVRDIYIRNCEVSGGTDAIHVKGGMNVFVANNQFASHTGQSVIMEDCYSFWVVYNRGDDTTSTGSDTIEIKSSATNNANGRPIRSAVIRGNIWEDVTTGQDFIFVNPSGTTEVCAGVAIDNVARKSTGDFDFIVLGGAGPINHFRIDSNVIASDSGAGTPGVGIDIGSNADNTYIGQGNCFENGNNVTDNGTNTTDFSEGGGKKLAGAWVHVTYPVVTIQDQHNVTSISTAGSDVYDINFTNAFNNNNFAVVGNVHITSDQAAQYVVNPLDTSHTTSSARIEIDADGASDQGFSAIIFGDI